MRVYLDLAVLLNFVVDWLLLVATNRFYADAPGGKRTVLAAALGAAYAGACLLPGFAFLGKFLWRLVSLAGMSVCAFGCGRRALHKGVLFALLNMALGGIAAGLGQPGFWGVLAAAAGLCALCAAAFRGEQTGMAYVPVELSYRGVRVRLTALRDTGNTLCDPVTGQAVLVASAHAAERLLGLTEKQLRDPIRTIVEAPLPGMRLIPYRAVGQDGGMLLAIRLSDVVIDGKRGAAVVAFAPAGLDGNGNYQALLGGIA